MSKVFIAFAVLFFYTANDAHANLKAKHRGVTLIGVKTKEKPDIKHPDLKTGMKNIAKAINVIYAKSSFSAAKLETLKKNGEVVIAYNPNYQKGKIGAFALASFFPDYYKRDSKEPADKRFYVVIGPHAIKWPTNELAMIIVHELVGHGIQHLRGRLNYIRVLDLECAANLYGEKFYQDLGIDKKNHDVIKFRKELEGHWCSDFKIHMRKNDPAKLALWDVLNPDVPSLLEAFDVYVNKLRDSGFSGKAIDAAKKMQQKKLDLVIQRASAGNEAKDMHALGIVYKNGLGTPADIIKAAKWFRKAADQGYAKSQFQLGMLHAKGKGAPKDYEEAVRLYRLAAEQGNIFAQAQLGVMSITGHGAPKDNFQANFWLTLAKDGYPQGKNRNTVLKAWKKTWGKLSEKQREEIGKLTSDWRSKHQ